MTASIRTTGFLVLCLLFAACPAPDFQEAPRIAQEQHAALRLPILRIPKGYGDCAPCAVFVDTSIPQLTSLHLVFPDENHPFPPADWLYDADRWWGLFRLSRTFPYVRLDPASRGWGRIADVETIHYVHISPGAPRALDLPGTSAGAQTWSTWFVHHEHRTLPWSSLQFDGPRPILWVNTWNHLVGPDNNNPSRAWTEYRDYPVLSGTRAEVEALYADVWTPSGIDLSGWLARFSLHTPCQPL